MRLGVLFSGGKDSTLALHEVAEKEEIVCLITLESQNKESFMFHTPNIHISLLQAEAFGLPLVRRTTAGIPEEELVDLESAIIQAIQDYGIEGVVTGAVESVYQSKRIQSICDRLHILCLNPLWKREQKSLLEKLVANGFRVIISGVFAYPLDESWLGKEIDSEIIARLSLLRAKYGLSISGEGGEIETTVLDAPLFKKRIEIVEASIEAKGNSGVFIIKRAKLATKR